MVVFEYKCIWYVTLAFIKYHEYLRPHLFCRSGVTKVWVVFSTHFGSGGTQKPMQLGRPWSPLGLSPRPRGNLLYFQADRAYTDAFFKQAGASLHDLHIYCDLISHSPSLLHACHYIFNHHPLLFHLYVSFICVVHT